jgi:hypothetical protein
MWKPLPSTLQLFHLMACLVIRQHSSVHLLVLIHLDAAAAAAAAAVLQMQFSLAALTAEQQERSARMHQLMEQLQTLAGDRDRAAAELLGAISEQVTALQQSTAEELQEVSCPGWHQALPDAACRQQRALYMCCL